MDLIDAADPRLAPSTDLADALAQVRAADLDTVAESSRGRVLAFVADHDDALHRSCEAGHLTGSGVVVDPSRRATLLVHHRKLGRWFQPGGHADGDANLAAVALREATEESGIPGLRVAVPAIDIDVHEVPLPPERPHLHLDVRFLVVAPPGAHAPGNHESTEVRWVELADLDGLGVDPATRRLVARALERAGLG